MSKVVRYRAFLVELLVVAAGVTGLGFVVSKGFAAHRKPAPLSEQVQVATAAPAVTESTPEPVAELPVETPVVREEPVVAPAPPPAPPAPVGPPPLTSLPLTLVATNVARESSQSTAVVDDKFYGALVYAVNDGLPNAGPIVAISPRYVDFMNQRAGRVERLDLLGPDGPKEIAASPILQKPLPTSPAGDPLAAELDSAVSKKDDTHFTVSRAFVDKVLENPMVLMGQLRARPTPEGLKLSGVKPGSAAQKLGLKTGDVITALNGHETAGGNLDKMLELYSKLKSSSALNIQIKRGGQAMALDYIIQ